MKPNEKVGLYAVLIFCCVVIFLAGIIGYSKGQISGFNDGIGYSNGEIIKPFYMNQYSKYSKMAIQYTDKNEWNSEIYKKNRVEVIGNGKS